eukprot:scaffold34724_cov63-Phaeocystis_antarctica.AAC.1
MSWSGPPPPGVPTHGTAGTHAPACDARRRGLAGRPLRLLLTRGPPNAHDDACTGMTRCDPATC